MIKAAWVKFGCQDVPVSPSSEDVAAAVALDVAASEEAAGVAAASVVAGAGDVEPAVEPEAGTAAFPEGGVVLTAGAALWSAPVAAAVGTVGASVEGAAGIGEAEPTELGVTSTAD